MACGHEQFAGSCACPESSCLGRNGCLVSWVLQELDSAPSLPWFVTCGFSQVTFFRRWEGASKAQREVVIDSGAWLKPPIFTSLLQLPHNTRIGSHFFVSQFWTCTLDVLWGRDFYLLFNKLFQQFLAWCIAVISNSGPPLNTGPNIVMLPCLPQLAILVFVNVFLRGGRSTQEVYRASQLFYWNFREWRW